MVSTYRYTDDFALSLQSLIDSDNVDVARDIVCDERFFDCIYALPVIARHKLIYEVIVPLKASQGTIAQESPHADFVAVMLASEPYHPLTDNEAEVAEKFGHIMQDYRKGDRWCSQKRLVLARSVADLYADIYDLDKDFAIGNLWPKRNASRQARDYFNYFAAIHSTVSLDRFLCEREAETDINDCGQVSHIFLNATKFTETAPVETAAWILHEMRHAHQRRVVSTAVSAQKSHGVARMVEKKLPQSYFALMNERQPYFFEGRMVDAAYGRPPRDEGAVMHDNLKRRGYLSRQALQAVQTFGNLSKSEHPQRKAASSPLMQPC